MSLKTTSVSSNFVFDKSCVILKAKWTKSFCRKSFGKQPNIDIFSSWLASLFLPLTLAILAQSLSTLLKCPLLDNWQMFLVPQDNKMQKASSSFFSRFRKRWPLVKVLRNGLIPNSGLLGYRAQLSSWIISAYSDLVHHFWVRLDADKKWRAKQTETG